MDEDLQYVKQIDYYKKQYPSVYDTDFLTQNMFIIPLYFGKEHKSMLAHCGNLAIDRRFNKLITALRTAVENGEGVLDKDATSHDDLFDAFRLSLQFWLKG